MEKQELNKKITRVFTFLIRQQISPGFRFPEGAVSSRIIRACTNALQEQFSEALSDERIVDYCVCQVYAISKFDEKYITRWNVSHSFGKKALERFDCTHAGKKFYEDKWLKGLGVNRDDLIELIRDRSRHPLFRYVYPEFEDGTKKRIPDVEARFLVCRISTMLWSPFSPVCRACQASQRCQNILKRTNPELYRLRIEEYSRK